jgi:hypothetical protein
MLDRDFQVGYVVVNNQDGSRFGRLCHTTSSRRGPEYHRNPSPASRLRPPPGKAWSGRTRKSAKMKAFLCGCEDWGRGNGEAGWLPILAGLARKSG